MNICFITKYPPIQGGVSMHCYWAARGLAERGHHVFVVTNAEEIEETFRIRLSKEDRVEGGNYAPHFPETNGKVEISSTTPPDRSELYYIPMGNPTVTRLATRATDIIRKYSCEVIFSYYLEPYGLAAHLASHWTNIPYVFKHAGSDLNRLMPIHDLTTAYCEVLIRANRVLSGGLSRRVVSSHGVPEERIESSIVFGLPRFYFNAEREPLDLNALMLNQASELKDDDIHRNFLQPLEPNLPVLGIYGKMGEYKGSFDLIRAIGRLVRDGFPLQLVALSRGWQEGRFYRLSQELGIQKYIRVHPFIPHWLVPAFIRACGAVTFLERDFPIAVHTPTIPTEILSCGRCLIISEEVLRKQFFRWKARNRRNLIVVSDPHDHYELAEAIRFALEDQIRAQAIGYAGMELVEDIPSYETYIGALEETLRKVAGESPVAPLQVQKSSEELIRERQEPIEMIKRLYPYVHALLDNEKQNQLRLAFQGTGIGEGIDDRREFALALGQQMYEVLADSAEPSLIGDVCRYEYKLHQWSRFDEQKATETGKQRGIFPHNPRTLVPVIQGAWEVQEFTFDVELVAERISGGESVLQGTDQDFAHHGAVHVFFREGSVPMRINTSTLALLALLEKERITTDELLSQLQGFLGVESREDLESAVFLALEGLYWEGALRFESNADS